MISLYYAHGEGGEEKGGRGDVRGLEGERPSGSENGSGNENESESLGERDLEKKRKNKERKGTP